MLWRGGDWSTGHAFSLDARRILPRAFRGVAPHRETSIRKPPSWEMGPSPDEHIVCEQTPAASSSAAGDAIAMW